jgi:hypothetical protein
VKCVFKTTSVALVIGPSVNTFSIKKHMRAQFQNWKFSKFSNVNTLRAQLIFPSKPNFCNLFEFLATKSTQKSNIFQTLALKIVKWILLNLTCLGLFKNKENPQIPIQFFSLDFYLIFIEKLILYHSSKQFQTKSVRPYSSRAFFKDIKSTTWSTVVWDILVWQTN